MVRGTFPFGASLTPSVQSDRTPKRAFVLGVHASAVYAKWIGPNERLLVQALAVANEPTMYWDGAGVEAMVRAVKLSKAAGRLEPAEPKFNGSAGRSLDEDFLTPLSLRREDAWLCDLVPYACLNEAQHAAIAREYAPRAKKLSLGPVSLPSVPSAFTDPARRQQILLEVAQAQPEILIAFGDPPLGWWVRHVTHAAPKLSDFGETPETYGRLHPVEIEGRKVNLLPLAHPKQVAGSASQSGAWRKLHRHWKAEVAPGLLRDCTNPESG